jgi:hypothetical protein
VAPKPTRRLGLIGRVCPAGQVTVAAAWSTVNASMVNPPGTGGRTGHGLMIGSCPGSAWAAPRFPDSC